MRLGGCGLLLVLLASPLLAQPAARARPVTLSNGLQVLGYEDRSTDLVAVFLALKVSAAAESPDLHGARDLLQEALRYSLTRQLLAAPPGLALTAALVTERGLDVGTEWDFLSLSAVCPRAELRPLLARLGQTVFRAPLAPEALAAARLQTAREWERYQSNPLEDTYYLFRRALLGSGGAAQPIYPDPATCDALTLDKLEAFRDRNFVSGAALLVLDGPDQPGPLVADAAAALADVPRAPAPAAWPPAYPPRPARTRVAGNRLLRVGDVERASLIMGYRFPLPGDPDYPAALVLFEMLAGAQGALETNQPLRAALIAGAWMRPQATGLPLQLFGPSLSAAPYVAVHVQMNPNAVDPVHQALQNAFAGVRTVLSDPAALARAQQRALVSLALIGLRPADRAQRLGEWALFARPGADLRDLPARLRAVKPADLKRVADRCFAQEYIGVQMPE